MNNLAETLFIPWLVWLYLHISEEMKYDYLVKNIGAIR